MMQGFWMVMSESPDRYPPRIRHNDFDTARREAKRLAKNSPGEKFFVLAAVGVAHTPEPVVFETIMSDEIPF